MAQTFTVYETRGNGPFFSRATILTLVFGGATGVFALFIAPKISPDNIRFTNMIYCSAVWAFCIGMWAYSLVNSRPKRKELAWDASAHSIIFNNTLFHISYDSVFTGRYVSFTSGNTSGTVLTIRDSGNELQLVFNTYVLPDDQYTTAEISKDAELFLMDDTLLKEVLAHVGR